MGGDPDGRREAIVAGTLRANDKGLPEVLSRWDQLLRFSALRLGRELGADVQLGLSRKEQADPTIRAGVLSQSLVQAGVLSGSLGIPDAIAPIDVSADLRAGRVTVSVVSTRREGRPATRINWLTRQLRDAPDGQLIDAWCGDARTSTSALLREVRDNPALLLEDSKKELRTLQ